MGIQKIDIEEKVIFLIRNNLQDIKLFFILFTLNVIIYGQKIFFFSLASDDFSRFYENTDRTWFLTRVSGRWAQDLFYEYIFVDKLIVLPYLHAIIGVLLFTFVGFIMAKYLKKTNVFEVSIITLLISATPMFAHNLYFNSGITTWISTAFGLTGFLMFYSKRSSIKLFGFTLLVVAIGNYQTIVQVIAAMIIFKSMLDLLQIESIKEIKNIFLNALWSLLFVVVAYTVSVGINEYILHHYDLTEGSRYKIAETTTSISVYIDRIIKMYTNIVNLDYFSAQLLTMYTIMGVLSILGITLTVLRKKMTFNLKFILLFLLILLFLSIPMVINLPFITGNNIPTRAHYTIGWILAGLFTIQMITFRGVFKTISNIVAISIIVVSTYYINVFFDAGTRQTASDITRANQIVNRIRTDKNYLTEPMKFKIVGKKAFTVVGWESYQQALNTDWSKYGVFKNFTDFKFTALKDTGNKNDDNNIVGMTNNEYHEVKEYLIKKGEPIDAYPGKNSIIIYKNKAILFLNSNAINAEIELSKLSDRKPDIESNFNLYIKDKNLYYKKQPCTKEDTNHKFFLHIYPVDKTVLLKAYQKRGFSSMAFSFSSFGEIADNTCIAVRDLPQYDILKLRTGQYADSKRDWDVTYSFYPKD